MRVGALLGFKHLRHQDYHFEKSEIPYTVVRSPDECRRLMLAEIEKHRGFVITAVTGDFGAEIERFYVLAAYLSAPLELRMERLDRRAYALHGERIRVDGDMHEQHLRFAEFAAARPLSNIDAWAQTLTCPVIHIDGTLDPSANASDIAERFKNLHKG